MPVNNLTSVKSSKGFFRKIGEKLGIVPKASPEIESFRKTIKNTKVDKTPPTDVVEHYYRYWTDETGYVHKYWIDNSGCVRTGFGSEADRDLCNDLKAAGMI